MHIEQLMALPVTYKEEIKQIKRKKCRVILFGAGKTSSYILGVLKKLEIFPIAFCDNDKSKIGTSIEGVPIIVPEKLKEYKDACIYVTTQMYYKEIKEQLECLGVLPKNIANCDWICQFEWENNYKDFIRSHVAEFQKAFDMLNDELSHKVLWNRLAFLITRERKYALEIRNRNTKQYFESDIISYERIRDFIDIGTYTGDTIQEFACVGNIEECRIWGFEPDKDLYQIAVELVKHYENVCITQTALADRDGGGVKISAKLGAMQTIEQDVFIQKEGHGKAFEVCRLDSFFHRQNVALNSVFLKMDIEGAELAALKGAEQLIRTYTPSLAVCVYHKADDILRVLNFIKYLCQEYRFYLRHYSDNQTETVLYAVIEERERC